MDLIHSCPIRVALRLVCLRLFCPPTVLSCQKRAKLFLRAKQNLAIDDDWTKAQTLFGITTYYRREVDGSLSIKLEGHLTGIPLFEQLAVLREADLYHSWAPFCVSSSRLAQLGKIDVVAWFLTGLPKFGLSRDACFRAIGCDSMREDGSILLVGEGLGDRMEDGVNVKPYLDDGGGGGGGGDAATIGGDRRRSSGGGRFGNSSPARRVDRDASGSIHNESSNYSNWAALSEEYEYGSYLSRDSVLDTIQIPPVPNKFGAGRMTIRSFQGAVDVLSPSSAKTRLITNIDPNLSFIPQSLIDYCMKKMCGILLTRLQGCARATLNDPVHSPHARRMREDVQFYRLWLLPKFKSYCEDLGWELPPVAAFNVSEEDLDEEEWLMYSQMNCLQEGGPRDKSSSRMESNAIDDINITEQQCGERTSSLDGQPLSRRLFSSERSLPGHNRTVASAPVVSQQIHPNGDGVRTKLRQLLPAESMEIALTRPDILQRWEQRQAKKKALEVASARRRAALRLRPTQPSGEQAARLAQLKEAKERFLKGGRNGAKRQALSRDEVVGRRASGELSSSVGTRPMFSIIIDWLSFTHPSIPHKLFLPIMVALMFALYHADKNLIHAKTGAGWAGNVVGASDSQWPNPHVAQNAIFCAMLGMYSAIFWIVMNLALVIAFDFIEFPLLSLAGTKRELENAKSLYIKNMRMLTAYFSMAVLVLAMSSCFLSYLWNHSLVTLLRKAVHLFDSVLVATFGKGENVIHLDSAAPRFFSSLVKWAGVIISPLSSSLGSLYHAFFRFFHWSTLELFAGFGSSLWECICSLVVIGLAVDTDLRYNSWREEALEKSITMFSYSSAFLCSFIAIAFCVFPTKSSGNNMAETKVDEIVNKNSSGTPNNTEVTAGSSTSFSLASGEIEDSPSTVPRQRAATKSLASISSNGTKSSKSRRFGFRRKQPLDKMTSIRSV